MIFLWLFPTESLISSFAGAADLKRCGVVSHRAAGPATALVTRCLAQPMLPAGQDGGNTWRNSAKPLSIIHVDHVERKYACYAHNLKR